MDKLNANQEQMIHNLRGATKENPFKLNDLYCFTGPDGKINFLDLLELNKNGLVEGGVHGAWLTDIGEKALSQILA